MSRRSRFPTATIVAKVVEGQGHRLTVERPADIAPFIVEKGYVTVDGVSLTVASVNGGIFTIALIPETSRRTTLGTKVAGGREESRSTWPLEIKL